MKIPTCSIGSVTADALNRSIFCRDNQSVVAVTQALRRNVIELIESWINIWDITPEINIIVDPTIPWIDSTIANFRLLMLDLFPEEKLEMINFIHPDDIRVLAVDDTANLPLEQLKIEILSYDEDLWTFDLKRVREDRRPKRSLIKESNRQLSKPRRARS